jgi:hypothetical protein
MKSEPAANPGRCPSCMALVPAGAQQCPKCQAPLEPAAVATGPEPLASPAAQPAVAPSSTNTPSETEPVVATVSEPVTAATPTVPEPPAPPAASEPQDEAPAPQPATPAPEIARPGSRRAAVALLAGVVAVGLAAWVGSLPQGVFLALLAMATVIWARSAWGAVVALVLEALAVFAFGNEPFAAYVPLVALAWATAPGRTVVATVGMAVALSVAAVLVLEAAKWVVGAELATAALAGVGAAGLVLAVRVAWARLDGVSR